MKLGQIAVALAVEMKGDPNLEITGAAPIESAQTGHLTFLSNPRYTRYLATTLASAIILKDYAEMPPHLSALISAHPYLTFARALGLFHQPVRHPNGIHPLAQISSTARLGSDVTVGPFAVVGDQVTIGDRVTILAHSTIYPETEIGDDTLIHSHCVVRERCRLGKRVILQNGVVIGSDGFGYAKESDNSWYKIPQTGAVTIEDDVEVGAGSVIDRATIGATIIRRGTKIDNLVQVGHSSVVGEDTLLCAQVGLAGSTQVGNQVILGGQVGAAGHLKIGDRVIATAQTGIPSSVPDDRIVSGYPAIENRSWLRSSAIFAQLPALQRELRQLRTRVETLEGLLKNASEGE
ncbi:MAG: UDP-3-O-(3-hydroxymyristoyl)glucosamine N-acyltransferase [Acidobacteriota bacterium]